MRLVNDRAARNSGRHGRGLRAFMIAVLSTLGTVAVVAQPASAATVDTSAYYQLVSRDSGKAIDVSGA